MLWRRSFESPSTMISAAENSVMSSQPNRKANAVEAVTTSNMDMRNKGNSPHNQSRRVPV